MLTVADIMTTDVVTIRSSAKVTQAIALMQRTQMRSLIVEREVQGGAYGIVTERDIVYNVTAKSADRFYHRYHHEKQCRDVFAAVQLFGARRGCFAP